MEYRLKRNSDFQKLFRRGKKEFSRAAVMLYLPSDKLRFGLSVSKKHGNSVRRNRIKRLLRAAFYAVKDEMRPVCVVFIPKVSENYSYREFLSCMRFMLKKAGLIPNK